MQREVADAARHQSKVRVPGVGWVRLRKGREIAAFGRAFIVEKNSRWYAVFEADREVQALAVTGRVVGVDRGITVLAATSDGELIANPRHLTKRREVVELHQHAVEVVSKRDAGGGLTNRHDPQRVAAVRCLARAKEREANARRDSLHKISRALVDRYDLIALEKLSLSSMTRSAKGSVEDPGRNVAAKSGLNLSLADAGLLLLTMRTCESCRRQRSAGDSAACNGPVGAAKCIIAEGRSVHAAGRRVRTHATNRNQIDRHQITALMQASQKGAFAP